VRNPDLARDYLERASRRLKAVDVLHEERGWADVVRESQELVELALKGLLRRCDIEAPRVHDVSDILRENAARLPKPAASALDELCEISRRLRRDRELSFYGSEDLTPSDFYREADAREARRQARRVVDVVRKAFEA
jgi:HEPN domain-containing protein